MQQGQHDYRIRWLIALQETLKRQATICEAQAGRCNGRASRVPPEYEYDSKLPFVLLRAQSQNSSADDHHDSAQASDQGHRMAVHTTEEGGCRFYIAILHIDISVSTNA